MQLNLIYAQAKNRVIGADNKLPWHLPEDLAHFKRLTKGCPVIMGRKTWDSLPNAFKPLPQRANIVITRQAHWLNPGAVAVGSLQAALAYCADAEVAWVIGGGELLAQAEPLAAAAFVTEIDLTIEGDAFAPELRAPRWKEYYCEPGKSKDGIRFWFTYKERQD